MANNKKQQQQGGSQQQQHPQAASSLENENNKEHVNAQIAKLQGSMDAQAEFQKVVLDELRQIRFGVELKFPVFLCGDGGGGGVDDADPHPLDWLSRAERFFNFYKVPEDQKVALASNHFQGHAALEWLILYERTTASSSWTWTHFVKQFLTHFGYGDIDASLLRLKQQGGGVDAYITDFIRLVSRANKKWSDKQLRGFFLNGLQDERLRVEVRLYQPETLSAAMQLARVLQERPPPLYEGFIPQLPRYDALFMGKTRVKVLMSSSSHNFISSSVLKGVDRRLIIKEDDPLLVKPLVLAGNGDNMTATEGRIDDAHLNLQGFQFSAEFYLLPKLMGCDIMLGNPWQFSLDQWTFGVSQDSFKVNGKNYQLTAEKLPPGTVTQPCALSLVGIKKSMLSSQ